MKIKKFEGKNEQETIEKIKKELGSETLILSIKKTQTDSPFKILKKPSVQITAAFYNGDFNKDPLSEISKFKSNFDVSKLDKKGQLMRKDMLFHTTISLQKEKIENLEHQLDYTEEILDKTAFQLNIASKNKRLYDRKYDNDLIQLFYDALLEQGVTAEIAYEILEEFSKIENESIDLESIVKIIYNKIINILGEPEIANIENGRKYNPLVIAFLGPTGVGKTTTIAKLSSMFLLQFNKTVGFITADTYRIAAVDQLKTYAEILRTDIGVAYNKEDLLINIRKLCKKNEILMIDTAGCSHKNKESIKELGLILDSIPQSENFLVLSITTKYEDLLNIVKTYSEITDFKIIFTKLDETICLGSILNICYITNKKISYITTGQNVPDDIEIVKPEKIAKILMGLGGIAN